MRILFVIPELSVGGTERQVTILARTLTTQGHAVRILALRQARRPLPGQEGLDVQVLDDVRPHSLRLLHAARGAIRRFRPDVVHTFLFGFDLWVNIAARLASVPAVLSSRRQIPTWRRRRHLAWQNAGNRFVDAVTANSEAAAEYACNHEKGLNRGRVYVIPNAHTPRDTGPGEITLPLPSPAERCILNVANLWPGKGQDLLLRAFRVVHDHHPDTALWLAGEGQERERLEQLAETLDIAGAVVFAGTRHDVAALHARAAVYVHASQVESSPNAILEALALGTPVVACAGGGTPELLAGGHYGRLVPTGDAETLARQIDDVLSNPGDTAPAPGAFRRDELPKHTPERVAERLLAVYASLVPSPGGGAKAPIPPPREPRIAVYTIGDLRTASTRYRCLQFFTALQRRGFRVEHFALPATRGGRLRRFLGLVRQGLVRRFQLRRAKDFDVAVVQKGLTPCRWIGLVGRLQRCGVPVLFDFDDAVTARVPIVLPGALRHFQDPGEPEKLVRLADCVLAGNKCLLATASGHNPASRLMPTVIDCRRYWCTPPVGEMPGEPAEDRLVLLWTGQRSTLPYLVEIIPELVNAARSLLPGALALRVICDDFSLLDSLDYDPLRIERVTWSLDREVDQLLPGDIGLMPQPDDDWTRGKCGAKALQYMALGKPVIASAAGFAPELIGNGQNGILVTTAGGWERAIRDLAAAPDRRRAMGENARETVEQRFSLELHEATLCEAVRELCDPKERDSRPEPDLDRVDRPTGMAAAKEDEPRSSRRHGGEVARIR